MRDDGAPPHDSEGYRRVLAELSRAAAGGEASLARLAADVRALLQAEIATREVLIEVYGVPEEWLDDVLRVRLDRGDERRSPGAD